ncbi:MAG: PilZ domain-containing protein [Desulfobacteraceae bacterium]
MTNSSFIEELISDVKQLSSAKQQELSMLVKGWLKGEDARSDARKAVSIPVKVVTEEQLLERETRDVSAGGTFVNLAEGAPFKEEQSINLVFTMPASGRDLRLSGRIVRVEERGIAVEYKNAPPHLSEAIEAAFF